VRGRLITIEGLDGAGKTTLCAGLAPALPDARLLREPGGVELSERIRDLVKDPALAVDPRAEALLYAAARAQLVDAVIRPALDDGAHVVADRFIDSSLAYQGVARGLGVEPVLDVNRFATGGLFPDRTVLLRLGGDEASRRRDAEPDRIEAEGDGFQAQVARGFEDLAARFPERIVEVDASGSPDEVLRRVRKAAGV